MSRDLIDERSHYLQIDVRKPGHAKLKFATLANLLLEPKVTLWQRASPHETWHATTRQRVATVGCI